MLLVAAANSHAADARLDLTASSEHVWRGQVLSEDAIFTPALSVSAGRATLSAAAVYDLENDREAGRIDLDAAYRVLFDYVNLEGGISSYSYPNSAAESTAELRLKASIPDFFIVPALSLYRDIDEHGGFYALLEIAHEREISEVLFLNLAASIGWADADYHTYYFSEDVSAWNDALFSLSARWDVNNQTSLRVFGSCSFFVDGMVGDAAEATYDRDATSLAGISLSLLF